MKILITGGLGYIGSHTVVALNEMNYEVVIIDNLDNSRLEVLKNLEAICGKKFRFHRVDVRDAAALDAVFELEQNIGAIIHFAAKKSVSDSLVQAAQYYDHNVNGLIQVLNVAEKYAVNRLVFSSSCTVYGTPEVFPVTEKSPRKLALTPYGNSKRMGEELLEEYSLLNTDFKAVILRYFNPVGAHQSGLIGELPSGVPANLMPFLTQTAAGIREQIQVFGNDYDTTDGTAVRDFIHVMDLADAHVKALDYLSEAALPEAAIFNIGTGSGFSVLELIDAFEKTNALKVKYNFAPRRAGDIEKIWADAHKANTVLGWKAKRGLTEMTESAWAWQKHLMAKKEGKEAHNPSKPATSVAAKSTNEVTVWRANHTPARLVHWLADVRQYLMAYVFIPLDRLS